MSLFEQVYGGGTPYTASATVTGAAAVDLITLTSLGLTNFNAASSRLVVTSYAIQYVGAAGAGVGTLFFAMDGLAAATSTKTIAQVATPASATATGAVNQTFLSGCEAPVRVLRDSGTSTGGSATTLDDTTKNFTTTVTVGDIVIAKSAFAIITARTPTQLTFAGGWVGTTPTAVGSAYYILPSFSKVRFSGNTADIVWNIQVEAVLIRDGKFFGTR